MNYIMVKLTKRDIEKIEKFADLRCKDSDLYKKRGSFKRSDITTGAAAEIGVHKFLRKSGFKVSAPDFNIYDAPKKSYDADLMDGTRYFHVKGQSRKSAEQYGASWLLQKSDPMFKDAKYGHYMITCVVDYEKKSVYIYACVPVRTLVREKVFGKLKIDYLNKTKVALYLKDLTRKLTTNRRWSILYEEVRGV
jgi:hypothetical protein